MDIATSELERVRPNASPETGWVNRIKYLLARCAGRDAIIKELPNCPDLETRSKLAGRLFGRVGPSLKVEGDLWCARGRNVQLGVAVYLSTGCEFWDEGPVSVGSWTVLGPRVTILSRKARPVRVGERVWLGEGVQLLAGAQVGDGAVVCAGVSVDGEVPPRAIVAGHPWRVIRYAS